MTKAFRVEEDHAHIAVVTFDQPDSKVNTLAGPVLAELTELVSELAPRTDLRGLLLRSGKSGNFIAGADLNELAALPESTREQAERGIRRGVELFARIASLPFPTIALIDGSCVGGGTELILAMDERIASTNPKTEIGLPETKIGIIPGWGGTQRLPRLIGVPIAIEMICSGDLAKPERAAALGLVFDAVPPERLLDEGRRLLEIMHENGAWKERRERLRQPVGMSEDQLAFAGASAEGFIRGKTKGHYPAPLAALRAIRRSCNLPLDEGLEIEREEFFTLLDSPICANLIGLFFMRNRLARDRGVDDKNVAARTIDRVGVLGGGLMGAGIAAACARSGIFTGLVEVDQERLDAGLSRIRDVVAGRIKIGRATHDDMEAMLAHLGTSTAHALFTDCDLVVEAITENEQAKADAYRSIADSIADDAILASNTSTISITRLAQSAPNPERFVGLHFFNPVDRMQLVEVIRGEQTSDETVATVVALAKRVRKTPIVVRDCAGFLVNRILFPYLTEAALLLLEGASLDAIDKVATGFGMPMGPMLLYDVVGLDTACFAGKVIHEAYPDRTPAVPLLDDLVNAGRLGQKSGAGFRKYAGRRPKGALDPDLLPLLEKHRNGNRTIGEDEILDRLFLPMLFEAVRAFEEDIVRDASDIDVGLVLGIGFPPFRGGILRWCDNEGVDRILERAGAYVALGKRFEPPQPLRQMAKFGGRFHPKPKTSAGFGA